MRDLTDIKDVSRLKKNDTLALSKVSGNNHCILAILLDRSNPSPRLKGSIFSTKHLHIVHSKVKLLVPSITTTSITTTISYSSFMG